MPSLRESSCSRSKRLYGSAVISAHRVMLMTLAICWAVCLARGVRSLTRKICTHATFARTSRTAMKRTLRHRSERGHNFTRGETWKVAPADDDVNSGTAQVCCQLCLFSRVSVRDEHVA